MSPKPTTAAAAAAATEPDKSVAAVRGASLLILLQVASRAITFIANQLLLRFLTAQLLGVSAQLEAYYLSVLFFARESLRVAIQRHAENDENDSISSSNEREPKDTKQSYARHTTTSSQSVVNIAYLSILLGLIAAGGLGWVYLHFVDVATAETPHLDLALHIYAVAAVVELLSEPAFVVLQHRLRFGPRAAAESIATFLRCLITFASVSWAWRRHLDLGALPFAVGQLAYGVGLLTVYAWYGSRLAGSEGFMLLPASIRSNPALSEKKTTTTKSANPKQASGVYLLGYFYKPTIQLASSLIVQSFVKHLLTQGDTFLVSILSDTQSQGIYALANNYGSLLARLVFQPIEESSRNYFSKLLSASPSAPSKDEDDGKSKGSGVVAKQTQSPIHTARADLQALLKFYVLLSIIVVSIGPFAAPLLVQIVAGSRWSASGAGAVLARYCLYIPLLAVNGVAEAFVSSVATQSEVHVQSLWMGAFSVAFAVAGFVSLRLLGLGAAGLVYANGINMFCRILWSGAFISRYFRRKGVEFGWGALISKSMALYVLGTAVLWGTLSRAGISVGGVSPHVFKDIITVGAVAAPFVGLIAYAEREYLLDCFRSIHGRRRTS
ncbi:Rft-1-domain-containing protein [Xylariaceae sp. FL0255]|nr:Rft-1-domain-containing protein [Xylariaceae sp. FL0255]